MKSGLKKGLSIATASLVGLTGLVGVMHMPFARSLLMKVGGCPITQATPEQLEQAQNASAAVRVAQANGEAPTKPALGFVLDKTTPDDVHAWTDRKGLTCSDVVGGAVITCLNVPAATIGQTGPDFTELQFTFHPNPRTLRVVSTFRSHLTRQDTLALMHTRDAELSRELGKPTDIHGQPDLQSQASAAYLLTYNFKDYLADEQATELPSGFALAEHYMSQAADERKN
jgi:hypothetical protein